MNDRAPRTLAGSLGPSAYSGDGLIEDTLFARTFELVFDLVWKQSKEVKSQL